MSTVFISYRRDDSQGFAGRLEDDLSEALGDEQVFRDREIPAGIDFVDHLESHLAEAAEELVLIGPRWIDIRDAQGRRRLDVDDDWVRREIERALAGGVPVVPVLVGGARMPAAGDLPAGIAALARRQAFALDDARWTRDLDALLEQLQVLSPSLARKRPAPIAVGRPPAARSRPWTAPVLRWLGGQIGRLLGFVALAFVAYVLVRALGGHDANHMLDRVIDTALEQLRLLLD